MSDNLALLEELAKRLDSFDSRMCLVVGEQNETVDKILKSQGVVPVWAKTLSECKSQIESRTVKLVVIVGGRALGVNLVRWMRTKEGISLPVVLISGGEKAKVNTIQEEYPVTLVGPKEQEELITSYFSGMKNAGIEFGCS